MFFFLPFYPFYRCFFPFNFIHIAPLSFHFLSLISRVPHLSYDKIDSVDILLYTLP